MTQKILPRNNNLYNKVKAIKINAQKSMSFISTNNEIGEKLKKKSHWQLCLKNQTPWKMSLTKED